MEYAVLRIAEPGSTGLVFADLDPNDPAIQEWKEYLEEFRRERDEQTDYPWMHDAESS